MQREMARSRLHGTASVIQERHIAPDVENRFQVVHEVVRLYIWVRVFQDSCTVGTYTFPDINRLQANFNYDRQATLNDETDRLGVILRART